MGTLKQDFKMFILLYHLSCLILLSSGSSVVVDVISGEHEDDCGVYPPCKQYGEGSWEILEDCRRYINCTLQNDGTYLQYNMMCPGDLVYANEYNDCVDYDRATQCKVFQSTPCLNSCPRVYFSSNGIANDNKERLLGCFRLHGTKVGNTLVEYMNMNRFYLTPDAMSTMFISHWLISEQVNPISGGIKNEKYDYVHCPYNNWDGWEVDTGAGNWKPDPQLKTFCHVGDEGATTNAPPISTTDDGNPTLPPQKCFKEGPNAIGDCENQFLCCEYLGGTSWKETECRCLNGNVYDQDFDVCTIEDMCGYKSWQDWVTEQRLGISYECDGGLQCEGM